MNRNASSAAASTGQPASTASGKPAAVYFYGTCLVDQFVPEAGLDAIRLLEREGIKVVFPADQTCCGQPAYTSGQPKEAREVAASQLALFPENWPIVVASGSCAGMMLHHWPTLFPEESVERSQANAVAARVVEFAQFLVNIGFSRPDQGAPITVALHTSCSARREMNTHLAGRQLLAGLANVTRAEHGHESECCGFGGTFSVRHPSISAATVGDKVDSLKASGAAEVVSADCGCLLNILSHAEHRDQQQGCSRPTLPGEHLASFLWRRTGGDPA